MILELHKSSIYLIVAIFSSVVVETVLLIKNVCKVKVCQRLLGHHGGWANVMDSFLSVDGSTANSGPCDSSRMSPRPVCPLFTITFPALLPLSL